MLFGSINQSVCGKERNELNWHQKMIQGHIVFEMKAVWSSKLMPSSNNCSDEETQNGQIGSEQSEKC